MPSPPKNAFGDRGPPVPAGGANVLPRTLSRNEGDFSSGEGVEEKEAFKSPKWQTAAIFKN